MQNFLITSISLQLLKGKETTCEVNLAESFGIHTTAIGRVTFENVITFDGIKYGEHQRFMKSTPAAVPKGLVQNSKLFQFTMTKTQHYFCKLQILYRQNQR